VTENINPSALVSSILSAQNGRAPLHVLTLTPFYPSAQDDAPGCFVAEAIDALTRAGVMNTVFAVRPFYRGKAWPRRGALYEEWLRYLSLPGNAGLPAAGALLFARIVGKVRELQRTRPIDVVHAHAPLPCGHAAMLLRSEMGLPYVVSVHGLDAFSSEQVRGKAGEWCRRLSQRVFQSSQRVICVSEQVRERVLEGTGRQCRTSVIYNGVDSEMFSPDNRPSGPLKILDVGNLIPIKGHASLIRALATLKPDFPSLTLEIIGRGPEQRRLEELAGKLECADRVRFLGRRSREETAAAMRRCTIFALLSRYEGLGCVYLEAMSTGKPVIGCRGQGIAEIIQHGSNGFLVDSENDRELVLALSMLLRDKERCKNLGLAARDTILDGFTLAHQAERFLRIYRECVG